MMIIQLRENIKNAQTTSVLVRNKDYKNLLQMQHSGGFKRFNMDVYDEKVKAKHTLKDSKQLGDFLSKVFAN